MPIHLVPLPPDHVEAAVGIWLPFIERIAQRDRADVTVLIGNVLSGEIHLALAWDADEKRAHALAGIRFVLRGTERRFEIIWLTGEGRQAWEHLLPDLERYLKDHQSCTGGKIVCRPGWSLTLKTQGYRTTHLVMERDFSERPTSSVLA